MNLIEFYKNRYSSDPYAILDAAYHDISSIAAEAGINWSDVAHKIVLSKTRGASEKFSNYNKTPPRSIDPKLRGRVEVYSRIETNAEGIEYPFINFVKKGFDAGSWSGLQFLFAEFNREKYSAGTAVPVAEKIKANIQVQAKKRAQRIELQKKAELELLKKVEQATLQYNEFKQYFDNAQPENGSFLYAVGKGISRVFAFCDIRKICWDRGPSCLAIPLGRLDNKKIIGWQRIYENGEKKQTAAINSGDYVGACYVIGDIKSAKKVAVCEGFATAASVYLATNSRFDAVVVAISANNLMPVVDQIVDIYPWIDIVVALDNDHSKSKAGSGNTGIKVGLEILKKYKFVRCVYPIFKGIENGENYSDFNDIHNALGLKAVSKQIFSNANKLSLKSNAFETELQLLTVSSTKNKKTFVKQLYSCIDEGMRRCPIEYTKSQIIEIICRRLTHLNVRDTFEGTVKSRVEKLFNQTAATAQKFRSFSERVTNPMLRPEHITYTKFNDSVITNEHLRYIENLNGPVIVRAPMGSGKSKHLLKPLVHSANSAVIAANRVTLVSGMWDMLTTDENGNQLPDLILHYQDPAANAAAPYANKLAICINSIIKGVWGPLMKNHELFGFDEAAQGLRSICSGDAMKYPVDVFNKLILAIAASEHNAVLVDADANDSLVELCEMAMQKRDEMNLTQWTQIHVIELVADSSFKNKAGKREARKIFYTDPNRIVTEILDAAKNNEKFILATDSKAKADEILNDLREKYPRKKWLYVSQDTKPEPDVIAFTDSPSKNVHLYDGLIYSPAISSGVSIETAHFTKHFGIFCGVVVPSDAIQMLRRDRTATEFMIGFEKMTGQRAETAENIRRGFVQALINTGEINDEFTDAVIDGDYISLGLADTPYTKMKIKIMEMESVARANFANNMLHILKIDGYEVNKLADNEEMSAIGKEVLKQAKERVKEAELMRHLNTTTPTADEREQLLNKRALTENEKAMLTRFDIENDLFLDVDEQSVNFIKNGGKTKIKNVEIRDMTAQEAAEIDAIEQSFIFTYQFKRNNKTDFMTVNALSQADADKTFHKTHPSVELIKIQSRPAVEITKRTYAALHRKLSRQYFNDCGIDLNTGVGEVTAAAMQLAMDNLIKIDRIQMFNNVVRFGGYAGTAKRPKRADVVFKSICKAHGYEVDKKRLPRSQGRGYVWFITTDSWQFISKITENRKSLNRQHAVTDQILKTDRKVIPDLYLNIYSKYKIEDHNNPHCIQFITEALNGLPISIDWAREVLTDAEIMYFKNGDLPLSMLRKTLIDIYMSEFMYSLPQETVKTLEKMRDAA